MLQPKEVVQIDNAQLADAMKKNLDKGLESAGGILEIVNPANGKSILRKNIFLQRGRTFTIEKLFGITAPADTMYIQNLSRTINLFRIGSGGAPINDPFNPSPVAPTQMDLNSPEPFRVVDQNDSKTWIDESDKDKYPVFEEDGDGKKLYKYKRFDPAESNFVVNKVDNKIYNHLQLYISPDDARDLKINELALCISTSTFTDIEQFSAVTFDTESMSSETNKGLLIHYYVYA